MNVLGLDFVSVFSKNLDLAVGQFEQLFGVQAGAVRTQAGWGTAARPVMLDGVCLEFTSVADPANVLHDGGKRRALGGLDQGGGWKSFGLRVDSVMQARAAAQLSGVPVAPPPGQVDLGPNGHYRWWTAGKGEDHASGIQPDLVEHEGTFYSPDKVAALSLLSDLVEVDVIAADLVADVNRYSVLMGEPPDTQRNGVAEWKLPDGRRIRLHDPLSVELVELQRATRERESCICTGIFRVTFTSSRLSALVTRLHAARIDVSSCDPHSGEIEVKLNEPPLRLRIRPERSATGDVEVSNPSRSFGVVAEVYDRVRPAYSEEALFWALGLQPLLVGEVGAGTGILTRQLTEIGHRCVAIEPDEGMRASWKGGAGAMVMNGAGERLPFGDCSLDAIVVGEAYHWLEQPAANEEMSRALRQGGIVAIMWIVRDESQSWAADLGRLLLRYSKDRTEAVKEPSMPPCFGHHEFRRFRFQKKYSRTTFMDFLRTRSAYLTIAPTQIQSFEASALGILAQLPSEQFEVDFWTLVHCYRLQA